MSFIDLSHPVADQMPAYGGDPVPRLTQIAFIDKNGYTDHVVTNGMHVGTHIDAPMHMIPGGKKISDYPIDRFIGSGKILDARDARKIDAMLLDTLSLDRVDILLIHTGWSERFHDPSYFTDYPQLTKACANALIKRGIKMIGIDTPSPDGPPYAIHKILLDNDVLIIENLANLRGLLSAPIFELYALPINFAADAAPARVMAKIA